MIVIALRVICRTCAADFVTLSQFNNEEMIIFIVVHCFVIVSEVFDVLAVSFVYVVGIDVRKSWVDSNKPIIQCAGNEWM